MLDVLYLSEINKITPHIDMELINYINEGEIETFESFDDFDIIAFDWFDIYDENFEPSQIMIYVDSDDIFFLCENELSYNKVKSLIKEAPTNERVLYKFFSSLLKGNQKYLEEFEDHITDAENSIILNTSKNAAQDIIKHRRKLLELKKYYEQLDLIFEDLTDNENNLITDDCHKYFVILGNRNSRMLNYVLNLRDYLTQVREAYQAQIDIEQNNIMKVFTVVTAIFLPLTLLVGWYGMNFPMPEFDWPYGYATVIGASVLIIIGLIIFFKRKKWI